jgi:hypothetical protein
MPKSGGVRECFVPRRGRVFLCVDYAACEMSTFADVLAESARLYQKAAIEKSVMVTFPSPFTSPRWRQAPDFFDSEETLNATDAECGVKSNPVFVCDFAA